MTRFGIIAAILATLVLIAPVVSAADFEDEYLENGTEPVAMFSAMDADGDEIVWSLEGDDASAFTIPGGVLSFKDSPDFESPTDDRADSIYKVIVKANNGSFTVEITVKDVDEPGKPGLTKRQPQVGRGLDATGPGDPDLPITEVIWQWSRRPDCAEGPWEDVGNPTASTSRNPVEADEDMYLRVTAMYTDKFRFRQDGVFRV